jgi:nitrate reductase gamma subunit
MNEKYMYSLLAVIVLFLFSWAGAASGLDVVFGVIVPYLAFIIFVGGFVYRVLDWAKSPVPFRIPTTCGQEKSLPWIKANMIDNPTSTWAVIVRMVLEITVFRSLFRNTRMELDNGKRLIYTWEIWLWLGALAFHYAFFAVVVRHLRFFTEPVPWFVKLVETLDGFFQIGLPGIFISGFVLAAAVVFLVVRRVMAYQVKYISLAADYFPLILIFAIALSGILMRYFSKVDVVSVKQLAMGLVTLRPSLPEGIGAIFYIHLFLVCVLLAYFPFSKLMHLGGIFLSPTRNLANTNRAKRHVNPWNYPVPVHTYDEYEDEYREKMIEAGLPVDKKE